MIIFNKKLTNACYVLINIKNIILIYKNGDSYVICK